MPRNRHNPLDHEGVDNDPLGTSQTTEVVEWGLPSDEGASGQHEGVIPGHAYPDGIFVDIDDDAVTTGGNPPAHLLGLLVDAPIRSTYEAPQQATHRRYQPPLIASISQAAAGYTKIVAPPALHYVKLLAVVLTVDAAGTLKFVQGGDGAGNQTADVTGAIPLSQNAGFVLPVARVAEPWLFTSPDSPLAIFTVTGKAFGWVVYALSPYDQ